MNPDIALSLYVFVLATFLGLEIIRRVSPLLHTPLMSLTNAISAIAVVGSLVVAGKQESTLSTVLGTVAVAASMVQLSGQNKRSFWDDCPNAELPEGKLRRMASPSLRLGPPMCAPPRPMADTCAPVLPNGR